MRFVIFFAPLDHRVQSMDEFIAYRVENKHLILTLLNLAAPADRLIIVLQLALDTDG